MNILKNFVNASNNNARLKILLDPTYYNAINNVIDKLDAIDINCAAIGQNTNCDVINNSSQQNTMMFTDLVNIYLPVFVRILLLMEKVAKELTQSKSCSLNPAYLTAFENFKQRIVGSLYMKLLSGNKTYPEQQALLKNLSTNPKSNQLLNIFSPNNYEKFDPLDDKCNEQYNWITMLVFLLAIGLIAYILFANRPN